ncbi:hypothetical protein CMI47_09315 [Candidatus Pacearchaeota archaeon]|nr:hypothetical protein [Candidatus Pacearchaeota archaeon]
MPDEWFDEGAVRGGHWGTRGSGILYTDGQAIFLMLRSDYVHNHPRTWSIPGGAVPINQRGEHMGDWASAAKETREEAGDVMKGRRIGSVRIDNPPFRYVTFLVKVSSRERQAFRPELNWENTAWAWFEQEDLLEAAFHPGFLEALHQVYDKVFTSPDPSIRASLKRQGSATLFDLDAELAEGSADREDPVGYVAQMESERFSFLGFGETEEGATEAVARAWTGKGRRVGSEPQQPGRDPWRRTDTRDPRGGMRDWYGISVFPVWYGSGYEDDLEVPPPPSIRDLKRRKK